MVKLIASDLDGTLLQNGAHDVNPIVFNQIRILKEHGILFAAASALTVSIPRDGWRTPVSESAQIVHSCSE